MNYVKRIELNSESSNAVVKAAIDVELATINSLGGYVVDVKEWHNVGKNLLTVDIEYQALILSNALHVWNMTNNSVTADIMTVVDTGSIGGLDLTNPTAAQLPSFSTINGKQSVLSDGVDDILNVNVNNFRSGDASGVMHFVFNSLLAGSYTYFFVNTNPTLSSFLHVYKDTADKIVLYLRNGIDITNITGVTVLSANTNYIVSCICDGSTLKLYLGTNLENSGVGTNNVRWFNALVGTTKIEMLSRSVSSVFYQKTNQAIVNYTPYTSVANALADQKTIADFYNIVV